MLPQTVMEFTFIEFDKNWNRAPAAQFVMYTAVEPAMLRVVAEDHVGHKTTYTFNVQPKEIVGVSYGENLVYIPARCLERHDGDTTKCEK